ncbi:uncharacterized protein BJ171DRAFT_241885 [Polychytrium aggregatum]|uniref:uncharacterized protein n=1 Tax=Polychytrium aggregatum TaxID=110093 RepID=UPI0022FEBFBC|nr:uncharacterized protein BJ171DRAFT_241885 [Polychytrium aggregatum]KAI9197082.1 hypothetical protein BJ171DRAFT_241885 [Polychytrium aggregatum]
MSAFFSPLSPSISHAPRELPLPAFPPEAAVDLEPHASTDADVDTGAPNDIVATINHNTIVNPIAVEDSLKSMVTTALEMSEIQTPPESEFSSATATNSTPPSETPHETAERLASLKNRLQALTAKHVAKPHPYDPQQLSIVTSPSSSPRLPDPISPQAWCTCENSPDRQTLPKCKTCHNDIRVISDLLTVKTRLVEDLTYTKTKLNALLKREDFTIEEMTLLRTQLEQATAKLEEKDEELESTKNDLARMSEKLVEEIEKRAELQHSKDAVQDELEELTKTLFEEANDLVATEARKRHYHETREKALERQLEETKSQLQLEQMQLQELKEKYEKSQALYEYSNTLNSHAMLQRRSSLTPLSPAAVSATRDRNSMTMISNSLDSEQSLADIVDPNLLAEFKEFLVSAPTLKLNKLAALLFMRNALEDDVSPCLRFGGNPRTSTRKLVDSIMSNSCFIEEMTPRYQTALQHQYDHIEKEAHEAELLKPSNKAQTSPLTVPLEASDSAKAPTALLFNKTVIERFTTFGMSTLNSSSHSGHLVRGCSTCGRSARQTPCRYHFRTSELPEDPWYPICLNCRDRLVAVCEFYQFVSHVRQGVYTSRRPEHLYVEMIALKRKMFYARIGAAQYVASEESQLPNDYVSMAALPQLPAIDELESRTSSQIDREGEPAEPPQIQIHVEDEQQPAPEAIEVATE